MKFTTTIKSIATSLLFVGAAAVSTFANATLVGDTISANGNSLGPASATIGSGVEFKGISSFLDFDFGANTLTVSSTRGLLGWSGFGTYTFSGFDDVITSLSLASNSGFTASGSTALFTSNFGFTDHAMTFNFNSGGVSNGAVAVFNINRSAVPEPETLGLFGVALLALAVSRRSKRI